MKKLTEKLKNEDGFTLIELSIVLVVIALLMLLIVPNVTNVMSNVNGTTDEAVIQTVEAQIELYKANYRVGGYINLEDLVENKYITQEQLNAYEKAKSDKDPS